MDGNQYFILNYLLLHENYVTYAQIAEELKVSSRTVLRYIKGIPSELKGNVIRFDMKRGKGIRLELTKEEKDALEIVLKEGSCSYYSKQDRIYLILYELFSSDEYVKSYYLSARLGVSQGTIERDLLQVSQWLEKNGLKLYSSKGKGICIFGKESNIRQGLTNLYIQFLDMKKITYSVNFTKKDFLSDEYSAEVKERFYNLLDLDVMNMIKDVVLRWCKQYKQKLMNEDLIKIIVYLVVMLQRNARDEFIEAHKKMELQGNQEFLIYQKLAEMASEEFQIRFQEDSVYYFTAMMMVRRAAPWQMPENDDLFFVVEKFLQSVEKELELSLGYDQELMFRLQVHLELMIQRVNMGIYIQNQYLDKIKTHYSDIFMAVKNNLQGISSLCRKNINDDEIGYLVIHILATVMEAQREKSKAKVLIVCMNGFGTSHVLSEMIKRKFPDVLIEDYLAQDYVNELEIAKRKIDLIISTVRLETVTVPVIVVDAFLGKSDEEKIKRYLQNIVSKKGVQDYLLDEDQEKKKDTALLLRTANQILRDFEFRELNVNSKDELIKEVCTSLDESTRKETELKIRERERRGSSVIGETGVLLLHCRVKQMTMIRCFSVPKGIEDECNGKKIKIYTVVLMLAPEEENLDILDLFGMVSGDLVLNPDLIQLMQQKDKTKVYQYVSDLLLNYINQWR